MNAKFAAAAILSAALGAGVGHASSLYALNPANAPFSATGQLSVTNPEGSYTCSVGLTGSTRKTVGMITGVTLSGAPGCASVIVGALPWKVRPISFTTIQITHFNLAYPGLGRCGPNQVKGTLTGGNLSIQDNEPSATGVCQINATLTTSPALSITTAPSN